MQHRRIPKIHIYIIILFFPHLTAKPAKKRLKILLPPIRRAILVAPSAVCHNMSRYINGVAHRLCNQRWAGSAGRGSTNRARAADGAAANNSRHPPAPPPAVLFFSAACRPADRRLIIPRLSRASYPRFFSRPSPLSADRCTGCYLVKVAPLHCLREYC